MTKVKIPRKINSAMDTHSGKADTKAQKTPKAERESGDKSTILDKKKQAKQDKQLREVDEGDIQDNRCGVAYCADCSKEVLESHSAISCDGCGLWHHTVCEKVPDEVYAFLCAHKDPSIHWMCRKCSMSFQQLFSSVMSIDEAQKKLEQKFDAMISKLETANKVPDAMQEDAQKRFEDKLTQQLSHIEGKLDGKVLSREEKEEEEKEEEDDKDRRKCNVIIHGLKEPTASEAEDRRQEDCILAEELLHKLSCDDVSVSHIVRLGAPPTGSDYRMRPVKLEFASVDARNKVLRNSKNLRREVDPAWKRVFLHPDLTPREREHRKELVKELQERKSAGESNLIIVSGKIVTRRAYTY